MGDILFIDCATGQAATRPQTQAEITQAQADAAGVQALQAAAATHQANWATVATNIESRMSTIQTWLANNPNGAVLTAAQTRVLAEMLNGIGKVLLDLIGAVQITDTTGT